MRMPFIEFIVSGDIKFTITLLFLTAIAAYHFFKKMQARNITYNVELMSYHNSRIKSAAFWIITFSGLALLLGLLHSFYFIGKAGGVAPSIVFQGLSYVLITPTLGVSLFIICRFLVAIFNIKAK